MLEITIPETELFNESTNEFIYIKEQTIKLEHSLVSIAKWERKWHKPYLSSKDLTVEETMDYVKCMTITQNVPDEAYLAITPEIVDSIANYIQDPMTATWFSDDKVKRAPSREIITAELIYYWMIANNIPPEYQKWHLNSLLTLIRVCNEKNAPPKKTSKRDIMARNASLNAARRKAHNTKG